MGLPNVVKSARCRDISVQHDPLEHLPESLALCLVNLELGIHFIVHGDLCALLLHVVLVLQLLDLDSELAYLLFQPNNQRVLYQCSIDLWHAGLLGGRYCFELSPLQLLIKQLNVSVALCQVLLKS